MKIKITWNEEVINNWVSEVEVPDKVAELGEDHILEYLCDNKEILDETGVVADTEVLETHKNISVNS